MQFDVALEYWAIWANQVKIPPSALSFAWSEIAADKYMLNGDQHDVLFYKTQCTSSMPDPVIMIKNSIMTPWKTDHELLDGQFGPVCHIFKHIIFIFIPQVTDHEVVRQTVQHSLQLPLQAQPQGLGLSLLVHLWKQKKMEMILVCIATKVVAVRQYHKMHWMGYITNETLGVPGSVPTNFELHKFIVALLALHQINHHTTAQ